MTYGSDVNAVKLMVRFDQAYIPFLALTNKGDEAASNKAMGILLKEWEVLEPEMRALFSGDDSAQVSISEVDATLELAVVKMREKEQLIEIHETLEGIKKPFITIRKEHDITYYPDMLDAYHTVMEEILNELTGKEADQLDIKTMQVVRDYAVKGQEQWNTISSADFESDLYGFTAEKTASLRTSIANAQTQEKKFLGFAEAGDSAAILQESAKLKAAYTQVYLLFGFHAQGMNVVLWRTYIFGSSVNL